MPLLRRGCCGESRIQWPDRVGRAARKRGVHAGICLCGSHLACCSPALDIRQLVGMDLQPGCQNFFARVRVRSVLPHVGGTSRRLAGLRQARLAPPRLVRSTCGPARESRGLGIDHPASTRNLTPCYGDPKVKLCISRYNPDEGSPPYMQDYEVEPGASDHMLLDVILRLKQQDPTLTLRKSCRSCRLFLHRKVSSQIRLCDPGGRQLLGWGGESDASSWRICRFQ